MTTVLDEFLESLQISLYAQRHHPQCIACIFKKTLRVIPHLEHDP